MLVVLEKWNMGSESDAISRHHVAIALGIGLGIVVIIIVCLM